MTAALYASHSSGTANCFSMQGKTFGWKAIEDMMKREVDKMKKMSWYECQAQKETMYTETPGQGSMSNLQKSCRYVLYVHLDDIACDMEIH